MSTDLLTKSIDSPFRFTGGCCGSHEPPHAFHTSVLHASRGCYLHDCHWRAFIPLARGTPAHGRAGTGWASAGARARKIWVIPRNWEPPRFPCVAPIPGRRGSPRGPSGEPLGAHNFHLEPDSSKKPKCAVKIVREHRTFGGHQAIPRKPPASGPPLWIRTYHNLTPEALNPVWGSLWDLHGAKENSQ